MSYPLAIHFKHSPYYFQDQQYHRKIPLQLNQISSILTLTFYEITLALNQTTTSYNDPLGHFLFF